MKVSVHTTVDIDTAQWAKTHDTSDKSASDVRRSVEKGLQNAVRKAASDYLVYHGQNPSSIKQTSKLQDLLQDR